MIIIYPEGNEWKAVDWDTGEVIADGWDMSVRLLGYLTEVLKYKIDCIRYWVKTEKEVGHA
jgi:hypothetical protein